MKNTITGPSRWRFLTSTLFIGGLLSLQNYGMFTVFPESTPYWFLPLLIMLFAAFLIARNIIQKKRLEPWVFPAFGGLLWELWWLLSVWEPRRAPILFDLFLTASAIVGFIVIYKRRRIISANVKLIAGVIIVSVGLLEIFRTSANLNFFSAVLISLLNLIIHTVPILALGLLLAEEYGSTAILFVMVYMPFFLEKYLNGNMNYSSWISRTLETQVLIAAFELVPFLVFLILMPVLAIRSEDFKVRKQLLGFVSFLAVGSVTFIRVFYLQAPDALFSLTPWAMWIHFVIVLCSPILLAILLYDDYQPNASTREVVVDA